MLCKRRRGNGQERKEDLQIYVTRLWSIHTARERNRDRYRDQLHYITLHYITLHYITLHYIELYKGIYTVTGAIGYFQIFHQSRSRCGAVKIHHYAVAFYSTQQPTQN